MGKLQDSRRDVHVKRNLVEGDVSAFVGCSGIINEKRNADRQFVGEPFSREAIIAKIEAVVADEYYYCVVIKIELF